MFKNKFFIIIFVFLIPLVLSGCFKKEEPVVVVPDIPVTGEEEEEEEIVEDKEIDIDEPIFEISTDIYSLRNFVLDAEAFAIQEWSDDAVLKGIDFSYNGDFYSYQAYFVSKDKEIEDRKLAKMVIYFNSKAGISGFKELDESKLIAMYCSKNITCLDDLDDLELIDVIDVVINLDEIIKYNNKDQEDQEDKFSFIDKSGTLRFDDEKLILLWGNREFNAKTGNEIIDGVEEQREEINNDFDTIIGTTTNPVNDISTSSKEVAVVVDRSQLDYDGDGLTNKMEGLYKTDPNNPDTDGDGYSDSYEIDNGYNPLGDGFLDIPITYENCGVLNGYTGEQNKKTLYCLHKAFINDCESVILTNETNDLGTYNLYTRKKGDNICEYTIGYGYKKQIQDENKKHYAKKYISCTESLENITEEEKTFTIDDMDKNGKFEDLYDFFNYMDRNKYTVVCDTNIEEAEEIIKFEDEEEKEDEELIN